MVMTESYSKSSVSGKNGYPDYHLRWHYNPARQVISASDISGEYAIHKI